MASRYWMLAITLLLVASFATSDVECGIGDNEIASSSVTGYVPRVWTQTTHADFLRGATSLTEVMTSSDSIILKARFTDPGVYVLVGGASRAFYRFNLTTETWAAMAPIPVTLGDGSSMVHDGSRYVYAIVGGSSTALYRYDVISNVWSLFASIPGPIPSGGDIAWDGAYLYVMGGAQGRQIWRLDPGTGGWTFLATTPWSTGTGASLLVKDGVLYVTRGGATVTFWKYTVSSGAWASLDRCVAKIGAGADLVLGPRGDLYCSCGNNGRTMGAYNITRDSWSTLRSQPYEVGNGGGFSSDGSSVIYSVNGYGQRYFYTYNRTLDSWGQETMLPAPVSAGGCVLFVPELMIGYHLSGTFTSETFNTGAAGTRFLQAFWDRALPAGTAVSIEVRVSNRLSGGAPAGPWISPSPEDGDRIEGRYVQWRATLTTTDESVTPELQEVRVYHYHA